LGAQQPTGRPARAMVAAFARSGGHGLIDEIKCFGRTSGHPQS
jgi:hypothetical protein